MKNATEEFERDRRSPSARAVAVLFLLLSGSARAGGSDHIYVAPPPPAVFPSQPPGPDVTKPYYYQNQHPLNTNEQLQLKAYQNQLYWQQQNLQQKQSTQFLTPDEQQRLSQTQREADRVNSMLAPSIGAPPGSQAAPPAATAGGSPPIPSFGTPAVSLPPPGLSVGPSPMIPAR
jgi:hypothetical protein